MGNIGSSLFATPQEKEFRKLTKKNTKANRVSLGGEAADVSSKASKKRRDCLQPLRFESLVTEVTYDREEGEIEVTRETLNHQSEDALGHDLIMHLVPTQVPVVAKDEQLEHADSPMAGADLPRRQGVLKRDSSFISAHAARHSAAAGRKLAAEMEADSPKP